MRLAEASSLLKRAQSTLLFMAMTRVKLSPLIKNCVSEDYMQRIEENSQATTVESYDQSSVSESNVRNSPDRGIGNEEDAITEPEFIHP